MKISGCRLCWARIPLIKPYILSFATITHIDSIIVQVVVDEISVGVGEAVALPGYSHETKESIVHDLQAVLEDLIGLCRNEIEPYLIERLPYSPFAVSAVLTAKEFAFREIAIPRDLNIPLIATISSEKNLDNFSRKAVKFYEHGFRTIKLKVGRNVEMDKKCALCLLDILPEDCSIRIDANQGFNLRQASVFLDALTTHKNYRRIECFEQPFSINAWDEFRSLTKSYSNTVPLMLDESIVDESDIQKAVEYGADMIKLKLFKHRGIKGLLALVREANNMGLKIVFGNGVSSEIGNLAEAVAFNHGSCFVGAFEGNGFCKLAKHIVTEPILMETGGKLQWEINNDQHLMMKIDKNTIKVIMEVGNLHDY
ncbi:MAG TPA: hypothetical protein EYP59_16735 [Thiotrichaceae bacterium]|nr:hypothetical protein [Thiotrichaceae bacterium]